MRQPGSRYEPPKPWFSPPRREVLVCIGIVAVLVAILKPVFDDASEQGRGVSCLSNGHDLINSTLQYTQDYDNHLPLAETWYDTRYNNNKLVCPALASKTSIGYAMDSRLSGRSWEKIDMPHEQRILLYESSNPKPNASDPGTSFAARHRYKGKMTAWIAFVDGHVKLFKADEGANLARQGTIKP